MHARMPDGRPRGVDRDGVFNEENLIGGLMQASDSVAGYWYINLRLKGIKSLRRVFVMDHGDCLGEPLKKRMRRLLWKVLKANVEDLEVIDCHDDPGFWTDGRGADRYVE